MPWLESLQDRDGALLEPIEVGREKKDTNQGQPDHEAHDRTDDAPHCAGARLDRTPLWEEWFFGFV